jgi:hypothetical protein
LNSIMDDEPVVVEVAILVDVATVAAVVVEGGVDVNVDLVLASGCVERRIVGGST